MRAHTRQSGSPAGGGSATAFVRRHATEGTAGATDAPAPERKRRFRSKERVRALAYELMQRGNSYDLQRSVLTGSYYIGWYDAGERQSRRRSLRTRDITRAIEIFKLIDGSGVTGDPIAMIGMRPDIASVLKAYEEAHSAAPSAGFNRIVISKHLIPLLGAVVVADWNDEHYERLKTHFKKNGLSLG